MPPKKTLTRRDVRSVMRKHLGKESGDAILQKISKMQEKRASMTTIRQELKKQVRGELEKMEKELLNCLAVIFGSKGRGGLHE